MKVIARCVHGLEWVCAQEIEDRLGVSDLSLTRRELSWEPAVSPLSTRSTVVDLSTVDDVFAEVGRVSGVGTTKAALPELARGLAELPWSSARERPLIDVVASLEGRRSYSRFMVEQAAGEVISSALGGRYLRRTAEGREPGDPELTVRLFLRGSEAIAAVRVGSEPAHRRDYKRATGPGTLHPPVAACLARLGASPLDPEAAPVVLDPFCGDGTIAIEAGRLLAGATIVGRDADPARVANARANADRAGLTLDLGVADAGAGADSGAADLVITNPPWNLAVDGTGSLARSLSPFWDRLPSLLRPAGMLVLLADDALDAPYMLRERGFALGVVQPIRLSGRIAQVILARPPGATAPTLNADLSRWKQAAEAAGATLG